MTNFINKKIRRTHNIFFLNKVAFTLYFGCLLFRSNIHNKLFKFSQLKSKNIDLLNLLPEKYYVRLEIL